VPFGARPGSLLAAERHDPNMSIPRFVAMALAAAAFVPAQEGSKPAPAATEAAAGPARGIVVGVVDVKRAFEQSARKQRMIAEMQMLQKAFDERLQRLSDQIDELRATMATLAPDSEERLEKRFELEKVTAEARGLQEFLQQRLQREMVRREIELYEDIDAAVAKVAKQQGVTIVLRRSQVDELSIEPGKMSTGALEARHAALRNRDVLYAADAVDLTADVIKILMVPPPEKTPGDAQGGAPAPAPDKAPAAPKTGG
jgi:Skp family chaperone for outer membrane proteins